MSILKIAIVLAALAMAVTSTQAYAEDDVLSEENVSAEPSYEVAEEDEFDEVGGPGERANKHARENYRKGGHRHHSHSPHRHHSHRPHRHVLSAAQKKRMSDKEKAVKVKCPTKNDLKNGGYGCRMTGVVHPGCINMNKAYETLDGAVSGCKNLHECTSIMKYINGKYYLRRADDPVDSTSGLSHLDIDCTEAWKVEKEKEAAEKAAARTKAIEDNCSSPPEADLKNGGYHCQGYYNKNTNKAGCINHNTAIPTLENAWKACRKVEKCTRIMRFHGDKMYYLRKTDDVLDTTYGDTNVDFACTKA